MIKANVPLTIIKPPLKQHYDSHPHLPLSYHHDQEVCSKDKPGS